VNVGLSDESKASPELPTHEGLALHRAIYNRIVREFLGGKQHHQFSRAATRRALDEVSWGTHRRMRFGLLTPTSARRRRVLRTFEKYCKEGFPNVEGWVDGRLAE
jgi:hypothetical protein